MLTHVLLSIFLSDTGASGLITGVYTKGGGNKKQRNVGGSSVPPSLSSPPNPSPPATSYNQWATPTSGSGMAQTSSTAGFVQNPLSPISTGPAPPQPAFAASLTAAVSTLANPSSANPIFGSGSFSQWLSPPGASMVQTSITASTSAGIFPAPSQPQFNPALIQAPSNSPAANPQPSFASNLTLNTFPNHFQSQPTGIVPNQNPNPFPTHFHTQPPNPNPNQPNLNAFTNQFNTVQLPLPNSNQGNWMSFPPGLVPSTPPYSSSHSLNLPLSNTSVPNFPIIAQPSVSNQPPTPPVTTVSIGKRMSKGYKEGWMNHSDSNKHNMVHSQRVPMKKLPATVLRPSASKQIYRQALGVEIKKDRRYKKPKSKALKMSLLRMKWNMDVMPLNSSNASTSSSQPLLAPTPTPAIAPAPVLSPAPAPSPVPIPAPVPVPAPVPFSAPSPTPVHIPAPTTIPILPPVPAPAPAPAPSSLLSPPLDFASASTSTSSVYAPTITPSTPILSPVSPPLFTPPSTSSPIPPPTPILSPSSAPPIPTPIPASFATVPASTPTPIPSLPAPTNAHDHALALGSTNTPSPTSDDEQEKERKVEEMKREKEEAEHREKEKEDLLRRAADKLERRRVQTVQKARKDYKKELDRRERENRMKREKEARIAALVERRRMGALERKREEERLTREREEQERIMRQRAEDERLEREREENERIAKKREEKARIEKERLEMERIEKERLEMERIEKEIAEKEIIGMEVEKDRIEKEIEKLIKLDMEIEEEERKEREEQERIERKKAEEMNLELEREEKERKGNEISEKESFERERAGIKKTEMERFETKKTNEAIQIPNRKEEIKRCNSSFDHKATTSLLIRSLAIQKLNAALEKKKLDIISKEKMDKKINTKIIDRDPYDNDNEVDSIQPDSLKADQTSSTGIQLDNHDLNPKPNLPPRFRNDEYYTVPSLSELEKAEEGLPGFCSRVLDFVVGRKGYGEVWFVGETDVRGLDLDDIVLIQHCEVRLYDGNSPKPPVGQGLNKPGRVTYLNVLPEEAKKKECFQTPAMILTYPLLFSPFPTPAATISSASCAPAGFNVSKALERMERMPQPIHKAFDINTNLLQFWVPWFVEPQSSVDESNENSKSKVATYDLHRPKHLNLPNHHQTTDLHLIPVLHPSNESMAVNNPMKALQINATVRHSNVTPENESEWGTNSERENMEMKMKMVRMKEKRKDGILSEELRVIGRISEVLGEGKENFEDCKYNFEDELTLLSLKKEEENDCVNACENKNFVDSEGEKADLFQDCVYAFGNELFDELEEEEEDLFEDALDCLGK